MRIISFLLLSLFLLTACGVTPTAVQATNRGISEGSTVETGPTEASASSSSPELKIPSDEVDTQINPRTPSIGEYSFSQLLPYDGIRPIYDPVFSSPQEIQDLLQDDELILGISLENESKAYPISVLRFREMVNDEMAGIPTLVTW